MYNYEKNFKTIDFEQKHLIETSNYNHSKFKAQFNPEFWRLFRRWQLGYNDEKSKTRKPGDQQAVRLLWLQICNNFKADVAAGIKTPVIRNKYGLSKHIFYKFLKRVKNEK